MAFFSPTGVLQNCTACQIHAGFFIAWHAVEATIRRTFAHQLCAYPDYRVVVTGHSLGAAVAALLGLSYEEQGLDPLVVTFGQPRVGNSAFATHMDNVLVKTRRLMRVTHGNDPVVHIPPEAWGFRHHGVYRSSSSLLIMRVNTGSHQIMSLCCLQTSPSVTVMKIHHVFSDRYFIFSLIKLIIATEST